MCIGLFHGWYLSWWGESTEDGSTGRYWWSRCQSRNERLHKDTGSLSDGSLMVGERDIRLVQNKRNLYYITILLNLKYAKKNLHWIYRASLFLFINLKVFIMLLDFFVICCRCSLFHHEWAEGVQWGSGCLHDWEDVWDCEWAFSSRSLILL